MSKKKVVKTEQELLEEQKRETWKNFQKLEYDDLTEKQRMQMAMSLYQTMSTVPAPPVVTVGYDFWNDYKDTDEIKELEQFKNRVENVMSGIPKKPNPEVWLDKERGVIPNMKKELNEKLEPFIRERELREKIRVKIENFVNEPKNKDKEMSFDLQNEMNKALENIEETVRKPLLAKINEIKEVVKKRTA